MRDLISIPRIAKLHPSHNIRGRFTAFIEECERTLNITLRVAQGFRTFAEQQAIYNQPWDKKDNDLDGRVDEPDERVTNAPAGKSFHNYAMAVDLVRMIGNKPDWSFNYALLAPIAKRHGIEWGGLWKGKSRDLPHFQITLGYSIQTLYKKFLNKDFIPGTQYVRL